MPQIRFSPKAIADLEDAKRYISDELSNPQASAAFIALVIEKIQTLSTLPQIGARLRTDISSLNTYRFIQCKNYLVFYRAEEKFVSIIRVLYAKRDYFGLLEMDTRNNSDDF